MTQPQMPAIAIPKRPIVPQSAPRSTYDLLAEELNHCKHELEQSRINEGAATAHVKELQFLLDNERKDHTFQIEGERQRNRALERFADEVQLRFGDMRRLCNEIEGKALDRAAKEPTPEKPLTPEEAQKIIGSVESTLKAAGEPSPQ